MLDLAKNTSNQVDPMDWDENISSMISCEGNILSEHWCYMY
jgi:hypothetical protein